MTAAEPTPIACTLNAEAMPGRLADWQRMLGFVTARSATANGVRLELTRAAPIDELARLAAAEQDCCRFLSFALTIDDRGIAFEVSAPEDALPMVHALVDAPTA